MKVISRLLDYDVGRKVLKGAVKSRPSSNNNNANYPSLFAIELGTLLENDNITASCQTNLSPSQA